MQRLDGPGDFQIRRMDLLSIWLGRLLLLVSRRTMTASVFLIPGIWLDRVNHQSFSVEAKICQSMGHGWRIGVIGMIGMISICRRVEDRYVGELSDKGTLHDGVVTWTPSRP